MLTEYKEHDRKDQIEVEPTGPLFVTNEWSIVHGMAELPLDVRVFGGDATITLEDAPGAIIRQAFFSGKLQFRIRGRNPSDDVARAFIDAHAPLGTAWYAYAIARHESRVGDEIYNQFEPSGELKGVPKWGTPDGWGLFQNDLSGAGGVLPPADLWNWQANVLRGLEHIGRDHAGAEAWMNSLTPNAAGLPRGQRPQSRIQALPHPPYGGGVYNAAGPSLTGGVQKPIAPDPLNVQNCVFSDSGGHPYEDAVAIKRFHGAPTEYLAWHAPPTNDWRIANTVTIFVHGQPVVVDYVDTVCREVGLTP